MTNYPADLTDGGFDVIGDVHGESQKLLQLLSAMGYTERNGAWRHDTRQAVFVGDLIDRGRGQLEAATIARNMADAGTAVVILGNHEFNAVAFHTEDPDNVGEHLRVHSSKNRKQHQEFLDAVGEQSALHAELIAWFMTLPMWFEEDGLHVVHTCWDPKAIDVVKPHLSEANSLTKELVVAASREGSSEYDAVEHLLKGPEIALEKEYRDKGGHLRHKARFAWWEPEADRLNTAALIPGGTTTKDGREYPALPDDAVERPVPPYVDQPPVVYGHYWATGTPQRTSPFTACVDYSAGNGGPLVAYRWSGEAQLSDSNFISSDG